MAESEMLVLVISRYDLDLSLIPPLKLIIPLLSNLYPLRLYTSFNREITVPSKYHTLYDLLVHHLEQEQGQCKLSQTLETVISDMQADGIKSYRVCLLGNQTVDWGIVMEFKRRNIVIDTANTGNKNPLLVQISYLTGGIHRNIRENSMIKTFQSDFMLSTKSRSFFKIDKKEKVQFSMECLACKEESQIVSLTKDFFACSVCLAVYCQKHQRIRQCLNCEEDFD